MCAAKGGLLCDVNRPLPNEEGREEEKKEEEGMACDGRGL
jgi:hypothetical protein